MKRHWWSQNRLKRFVRSMFFCLIRFTLRTMLQITSQITKQVANVSKKNDLFIAFNVIEMINFVMRQLQYVLNDEIKNTKSTKFVNVIFSNEIIRAKNEIVFSFIKKQFCDVFVVFDFSIQRDENTLSIEINLVID